MLFLKLHTGLSILATNSMHFILVVLWKDNMFHAFLGSRKVQRFDIALSIRTTPIPRLGIDDNPASDLSRRSGQICHLMPVWIWDLH
jgi:hypothetical protein